MELRRWAGWGGAIGLVVALIVAPALAQRTRPTPPAPVPADDAPPAAGTPRGENFSAKPPAQLFASDCTGAGCHKGPQGLGKNAGAFGLTNFLRQHYTNSQQSAAALAAYLAGIPGEARPVATNRKGPEPKSRASVEPPDAAPKPPAEKKTPPSAAKQPQRKQATAEQPPAASTPEPAAPPPPPAPPPPKVFDIFD